MKFFKKTILNGILLLIPITITGYLLYKVIGVLKLIARPISSRVSYDFFGIDIVSNLIIILLFILVCFVTGLIASKKRVSKFVFYLENNLLIKIPGYIFFKGISDGILSSKKSTENFEPVLVEFDDNAQLGFKIESLKSGEIVVYVPGSPVPWSGSIIYVAQERVRLLDTSVTKALKHMQHLGRGSEDIVYKNTK